MNTKPEKSKPLETQLNIRLSGPDRNRLTRRAKRRGFTSASAFVRYLIVADEADTKAKTDVRA